MHVEVECPILARVYRAVATALFRQEIASLIRAAIGRVIMRLEKKKEKNCWNAVILATILRVISR